MLCPSPCVSQIRGVVEWSPAPQVSLVDVGSVLKQELTGDQRALHRHSHTVTHMFTTSSLSSDRFHAGPAPGSPLSPPG